MIPPEHDSAGIRQQDPRPLLIYGAGVVGKVLYQLCEALGLTVEAFCDGSTARANTTFCDRPVIHASDLPHHYQDARFLISVASIKDVVDKLHELGYRTWKAGGPLLKQYRTSPSPQGSSFNYVDFAVETCIWCHDAYLAGSGLFIRSVDVVITERCSLRCKDCSNLMQYYENPRDCDWDKLMASIGRFCDLVDDVLEFRVIGGEAFMNKRWPQVVGHLVSQPKAKRVVLYTNGTILPPKNGLEALKHPKVLVIISNYGKISRKLLPLKKALEDMGIKHYILNIDSWLDCARIEPHHRPSPENKRLFADCCAKNMLTLSDGRLHRCPFSANAFRLGAIPDFPTDYVDLFEAPLSEARENLRKEIWNYLHKKEFLHTCDFCNGRPLAGPEVLPAVQIGKPLPYRKYEMSAS
ncbi:MAG: hypothetical protein WHS86_09080 [Desulfosoma sp.]